MANTGLTPVGPNEVALDFWQASTSRLLGMPAVKPERCELQALTRAPDADCVPACSREASASGLRVRVLVTLPMHAAQRTADEALFAALGGLSLDVLPTAAQRRALTPHAARRVAWHLCHGAAHMRGNAAWLLHAHAEAADHAHDKLGAALYDADVLAALVEATTARALLRAHVAARKGEATLQSEAVDEPTPSFLWTLLASAYRRVRALLGVVPAAAELPAAAPEVQGDGTSELQRRTGNPTAASVSGFLRDAGFAPADADAAPGALYSAMTTALAAQTLSMLLSDDVCPNQVRLMRFLRNRNLAGIDATHVAQALVTAVTCGATEAAAVLVDAATWRAAAPCAAAEYGGAARAAALMMLDYLQRGTMGMWPVLPSALCARVRPLVLRAALAACVRPAPPAAARCAGVAAALMSLSAPDEASKFAAVAAGGLTAVLAVAAAADVYDANTRGRAIAAAGNLAHGAGGDASKLAPLVAMLRSTILQYADELPALAAPGAGEEAEFLVQFVYNACFAVVQTAPACAAASAVLAAPDVRAALNKMLAAAAPRGRRQEALQGFIPLLQAQVMPLLDALSAGMQVHTLHTGATNQVDPSRPDCAYTPQCKGAPAPAVPTAATAALVRAMCTGCGTHDPDSRMQLCARCRKARYCSPVCQRAHWKTHKKVCALPV